MLGRIWWWVALALTLTSFLCIGVMFARAGGILLDLWRDGAVPFASVVDRIREGRAWGIAGMVLFGSALVLLWVLPHRGDGGAPDAPP
jgi:hypothetical protein